jgi:hypothetical protein
MANSKHDPIISYLLLRSIRPAPVSSMDVLEFYEGRKRVGFSVMCWL